MLAFLVYSNHQYQTEYMPQKTKKFKLTAGKKCEFLAMIDANPKLKTQSAKTLARAFLDLCELEGYAFARQPYLEFRTGIAPRTQTNANREIQASGLFSLQYRPNKSTIATPNWQMFEAEYAAYRERDIKIRAELNHYRDKSRSAEIADPDQQKLRTGSAETAGVISLGNPSSNNLSNKERGRAAILSGDEFLERRDAVNDNQPDEYTMTDADWDKLHGLRDQQVLDDHDATPSEADTWPVGGLALLMEIHPPDRENVEWTEQMYWVAHRQFHATIPFKDIVAALKYDVAHASVFSIPRLAVWLRDQRWTDEDREMAA